MHFALNSEQTLLRDTIDRFLAERYSTKSRSAFAAQPRGYSLENWREMSALGLLALPFSPGDGGLNGDPWELIAAMELFGRHMAVEPLLEEVVLAAGTLAQAGKPAQKSEWLPRVIAGEAHIALAHFEHRARFNLQLVQVEVRKRADTIQLYGQKSVVPLAAGADIWIVSARERGDESDPSGIGFYLVDPHAPGIERRDFRLIGGTVASSISFEGAAVKDRLQHGYVAFTAALNLARIAAGAEMVGIMSTLLDQTLGYLRERKQFGKPLSSFQALQHRLADLYVSLEQSRSHLYRGVLAMKSGRDVERSLAGMKSYLSDAATVMGETCVHLHGGLGTTEELPVAFGYKRLIALSSLLGDTKAELDRFIRLA